MSFIILNNFNDFYENYYGFANEDHPKRRTFQFLTVRMHSAVDRRPYVVEAPLALRS
jgi:hypothetical protein